MAQSRARGVCSAFILPTACVLTQSGAVMATKNEPPAEADKDEAEGADGKDAAPKRRFSLKLIIMVAGGVVGLCALGGGGCFFFGNHATTTAPAATTIKPPIFVDMPDVLVNLSSGGGDRTQYLKV